MAYKPILIKEDIKLRPRQIPKPDDFNNLCNTIIRQNNNITLELIDIFIRVNSCEEAFSDLQEVLQRQVDGIIAGVMPDGSINYNKFIQELRLKIDSTQEHKAVLDVLRNKLNTVVNNFNTLRASNTQDINNLKGVG